MSNIEACQVAVIGGGLVGAATALALLKQGLRVALIEQHPAPLPTDAWESRIYAISPASEALLRELGAWQRMDAARLQAIYRMDVQGDANGHIRFDAYESGVARLATIVESGRLQQALWQTITELDETALRCPLTVKSVDWGTPTSTLHLSNGATLRAELVVAADGAQSKIRDLAGLTRRTLPYQQHGVVANFACELPHYGTAFQWFSPAQHPGDIVAYLPLVGNRISLVWSTQGAPDLLALDAECFTRQVESVGQMRLGKFDLLTPPAAFPLQLIRVDRTTAPGLVLVGDAAHGVHPLAGQGVNLGFGDVAALRAVLEKRGLARCGDERLLARYARQRALPVVQMQGTMHGLFHLFNLDGASAPRNGGMNFLDHLGFAKSALVREATHFSQ
ncbi:MAG: FAD-dependent oxidoreductase [Thiobacillaceae bacterium]